MKKSSNVLLLLTLALGISACEGQSTSEAPSYGKNKKGDSVMTKNGKDYYHRGTSGWVMIPHGYYGSGYQNNGSTYHGGTASYRFTRPSGGTTTSSAPRSSYSSTSTTRGGFGTSSSSSFGG